MWLTVSFFDSANQGVHVFREFCHVYSQLKTACRFFYNPGPWQKKVLAQYIHFSFSYKASIKSENHHSLGVEIYFYHIIYAFYFFLTGESLVGDFSCTNLRFNHYFGSRLCLLITEHGIMSPNEPTPLRNRLHEFTILRSWKHHWSSSIRVVTLERRYYFCHFSGHFYFK